MTSRYYSSDFRCIGSHKSGCQDQSIFEPDFEIKERQIIKLNKLPSFNKKYKNYCYPLQILFKRSVTWCKTPSLRKCTPNSSGIFWSNISDNCNAPTIIWKTHLIKFDYFLRHNELVGSKIQFTTRLLRLAWDRPNFSRYNRIDLCCKLPFRTIKLVRYNRVVSLQTQK